MDGEYVETNRKGKTGDKALRSGQKDGRKPPGLK
jgi:hypothetical protein